MEHERHIFIRNDDGAVWVRRPLGDAWVTYVRFEEQGGHPVVAELRVLPRVDTPGLRFSEDAAAQRQWLDVTGSAPDGAAPEGGLTTRALRGIHLGRALEQAYVGLADAAGRDERRPDWLRLPMNYADEAIGAPRRPGRRGREDIFYAQVAAAYVDAVRQDRGRAVVVTAQTLSERWGGTYEPTYVRDLLTVARRRELLTPPPKGRAGGDLTDKARALLQRGDSE